MKKKEIKELTPEEQKIKEVFEKEYFTKAVLGIISLAVFMVILFSVFFFTQLQGREDTKVPVLEGIELHEGLIKLQEKALYPKITTRYSVPSESGIIISQDLAPGSVVKAGRIINLSVSLGGVIDKVGSYTGQTLDSVKGEFKKLFSTTEPLLVIADPIQYVSSDEPEGTILEQDPLPGTEISDVTRVHFVVSSGAKQTTFTVPTMEGLGFKDALDKITSWSLQYRFSIVAGRDNDTPGSVISQRPESGKEVPWRTTVVEMEITEPDNYPSDFAFGMLEMVIDRSPVLVNLKVEKISIEGNTEVLVDSRTHGGPITIPYLEQVGTEILVKVQGQEIKRFTVRRD